MTEQVPSEQVVYTKGQELWWKRAGAWRKVEFVKLSSSGKRAFVRYEKQSRLSYGSKYMTGTYVDPKNLEPRSE